MSEELRKLDDTCLIINFMRARDDINLERIEDVLTSTISIICDKDKRQYLNNIKKWQKEESEEFPFAPRILEEKAYEKKVSDPLEAYLMAWEDVLSDLNPNDDRNRLKGIPMIEVQFIDHYRLIPELLIKGDLEGVRNDDECMIVNHARVFFGKMKEEDFGKTIFQEYFIKNNVALLCGKDKTEYLEKLEKSTHHEYFGKKHEYRSSGTSENLRRAHEILTEMWEDLEPPNKTWEDLPFLDVHEWKFPDDETILLELMGEITQKWKFPEPSRFIYEKY
jgi:hypothetical protein